MSDDTPTHDPTAVAIRDDDQLARLQAAPIIDTIHARQLALIRSRSARGCDEAEVAQFIELCVAYGLDPYAGEAWAAKGKGDNAKVLLMVGRDGLRKIAKRVGLKLDGDVVRAQDEFAIVRDPETRKRAIRHEYVGGENARGEIVGAWAECFDPKTGDQHGYFYAPLAEYMPTNESQLRYSPWGSQRSVMILAAAERQALRQAVSLSGVVAEGELDAGNERALGAGTGSGDAPEGGWGALDPRSIEVVEAVLARAQALGHVGLADRATAQMTLAGQSPEAVDMWVAEANADLDVMEAELVPDAEVVVDDMGEPSENVVSDAEGAPVPESTPEAVDGPQAPQDAPEANESDLHAKLEDARERLIAAEAFEDEDGAAEVRAEVEAIEAELSASEDAEQGSLGL